MTTTLVESTVEAESATMVSSWEPPRWVTAIDTTGDAAAGYSHDIGRVGDFAVRLHQYDRITTDPTQITISRSEPVILVSDSHLGVAEVRRVIALLNTAIDIVEGRSTS